MSEDQLNDELKQMYDESARARVLDSETLKAPIGSLRLKSPIAVSPNTPVTDAIGKMTENHIGCLMVMDGSKLVGIFTERDVLTRVGARNKLSPDVKVSEVMTADPSTLTADHMIAYALNFMHVGGFRHVPVVDDSGTPIGLVGVRDVLKYLAGFFPEEVKNLPPPTQATDKPLDGG